MGKKFQIFSWKQDEMNRNFGAYIDEKHTVVSTCNVAKVLEIIPMPSNTIKPPDNDKDKLSLAF
jgi:hypothetical protein